MTIDFDTAGSGIFARLGHYFGGMADVNAIQGATATARVLSTASMIDRFATIAEDAALTTTEYPVVDGAQAQLTAWQSAQGGLQTYFSRLSANMLIAQVNSDTPLPGQTVTYAMTELIRQMKANSISVQKPTVTAGSQTAQGSPTGTAIVVVTLKNGQGLQLDYVFPETLKFACSADAQQGQATAGQEPLLVTAPAPLANTLAYNWPLGSGTLVSLNAVSGASDNSGGNLLTNSDFETFTTTNVPDNWTIAVGAATTNVLAGGSPNAYTGTNSLALLGDTPGTLTAVTQLFDTTVSTQPGAGGTPGTLLPATVYHINLWIKCSSTPAAGVLTFSLVDGSGSNVADDQSVANSFTKSLTSVSTSWVNVNGSFRTPTVMPTSIKLKIQLTTAITDTKLVYLDRIALAKATQLYAGGPFAVVFSGATNLIAGDTWTVAIANNYSGKFVAYFERTFGMRQLGLTLPSNVSPTVSESLIQ